VEHFRNHFGESPDLDPQYGFLVIHRSSIGSGTFGGGGVLGGGGTAGGGGTTGASGTFGGSGTLGIEGTIGGGGIFLIPWAFNADLLFFISSIFSLRYFQRIFNRACE